MHGQAEGDCAEIAASGVEGAGARSRPGGADAPLSPAPCQAPLTDTHCHLDQFDEQPGGVAAALDEAAEAGVTRIVAVSQDAAEMDAVLGLATRFPDRVLAGLGIHPCRVTQRGAADLAPDLELLAARAAEAAVIGESGLDHKWARDEAQQAEQDRILERHFEVAAAHRKPVNLHSRQALRPTLERAVAFHRDTGLHAQMHWFTQSKKLVRICNEEGIYVSAGPSILRDPQAADAACELDPSLLLLETDAPVPIGRVPGHPRRVREVAEKLAGLRGVPLQDLAAQLEANLRTFLGAGAAPTPAPH